MAIAGRRLAGVLMQLCVSFVLPVSLGAQVVTIDFEHFPGPDGLLGTADDVPTPVPGVEGPVAALTNQYASLGITFSQGTLSYHPSFWPGHDHYVSSSPPVATFTVPVYHVSITSYSFWRATLTAYDASENVLGTSVLEHPAPGDYPLLGTLSLSTTRPIARFSVLPDNPEYILNLDDLYFADASGLIDFEHYPGPDGLLGTVDDVPTPVSGVEGPVAALTNQYASLGITFSQGTLFYGPSFWPGHDHYISSTAPVATFSVPVYHVSITSYSSWRATLTAYDASDNVLGTSVLDPGDYPGILSLSTTQPIARFSVLPDNPEYILNLDDLYFADTPGLFTLTPCRLLDTRDPVGTFGGPALAAGADRVFPLFGRCGIPARARALSVNLTVTQPTAAGHLRLYPADSPMPPVSSINYGPGQTRANNAIVSLSGLGELAVRCQQAGGTTHFILDVNGYFE